jgi:hypothetical protein
LGVLLFFALGNEVTEQERHNASKETDNLLSSARSADGLPILQPNSAWSMFGRCLSVMKLLKDPRMVLLVPVCIYSGMEQSFVSGAFNADIVKATKGVEWVGM